MTRLVLLVLALAGLAVVAFVSLGYISAEFRRGAMLQARTDGQPVLVRYDHALATPAGGRDGCLLRRGSGLRLGEDAQGGSSMRVTVTSVFDASAPGDCRPGETGEVDAGTLPDWTSTSIR